MERTRARLPILAPPSLALYRPPPKIYRLVPGPTVRAVLYIGSHALLLPCRQDWLKTFVISGFRLKYFFNDIEKRLGIVCPLTLFHEGSRPLVF
ncbi:MAG TPA: hypothetical protein VNV88_14820 [Candidatus Solibacter sp.]|nr:hypothetical protein [Candidatus Solibacter sp.]